MASVPIISLAILLYLVCTVLIALRIRNAANAAPSSKTVILIVGATALICHAIGIYPAVMTAYGFNLSLFNTFSISGAIISLLTMVAMMHRPVELLAMLVLPITATGLVLGLMFPTTHLLPLDSPVGLQIHVVLSILAYSLMGLAATHAVLLAIQNSHLHRHQPGGLIRVLPPLQTMEKLLFEIILVGFVFLSLALLSGFFFLENLFAQHLAHKTILSILAWVLFAALLIGHRLLGWRGRIAIRWTLGGFFSLMLAYFGSKFVLEFIIN